MNPGDIIDLGFQIVGDEDYHQEARIRTAINRIYYGTLHFLRKVRGIPITNNLMFHSELVGKINDSDKTLDSLVDQMKKMRTKADYKINKSIGMREFKKVKIQLDEITNRVEVSRKKA